MKKILVGLVLCGVAWAGDFQKAKLVDVQPYEVENTPFLATNTQTGDSVIVGRGSTRFYLISVALEGIRYSAAFGEWKHFKPSQLVVGDDVEVRIDGDHMMLKDDRGKEIKHKILRRERITEQQVSPPHASR